MSLDESALAYSPETLGEALDGIAASTIRQLCREGAFPRARKIGRQWRIPKDDVETYFGLSGAQPSTARASGRAVSGLPHLGDAAGR